MKKRLVVVMLLLSLSTLACLNPIGDQTTSSNTPSSNSDVQKPAAPKASRSSVKLNGTILYASQGTIWAWSGTSAKQVVQGNQYVSPCWDPSGKRFAYVERGNSYSDLLVAAAGGGDAVRLTKNQSKLPVGSYDYATGSTWALAPAWSPDGSTVAYLSDPRTQYMGLFTISPDGSKQQRLVPLPATATGIDRISWSPDGNSIAVTVFSEEISQVWSLDLTTRKWTQFTDSTRGALDPAWSPDGKRLAFAGRGQDGTDVWLERADGGELVQVTTNGTSRSPAWSPDGKYLAFVTENQGSFDIWMVEVSTTAEGITSVTSPQQVTENAKVDTISGLSWAN